MPIYAYRCGSCGFQKDVLQKLSDQPLRDCPSCGEPAFSKQLSAPAFQLKGTGWYVTDFRDNGKKPDAAADGKPPADGKPATDGKPAGDGKADGAASAGSGSGEGGGTPAASPAPAAAAPSPAPSPGPAAGPASSGA